MHRFGFLLFLQNYVGCPLRIKTTKAVGVISLSFHFLKGNWLQASNTKAVLVGTFKVAFMSSHLCTKVTGWITAGTGGWPECESREWVGGFGYQLQALFLYRAGRMLLALSWKTNSKLCLLYLWELVCGVFRYAWQADTMAWLNTSALIAHLGNHASTVTTCSLEAGNKMSYILGGKWVKWILVSFSFWVQGSSSSILVWTHQCWITRLEGLACFEGLHYASAGITGPLEQEVYSTRSWC